MMNQQSRETLEELNRRAKRLAKESRPDFRIRQERWKVAMRIIWLCLLMIGVFTVLTMFYIR